MRYVLLTKEEHRAVRVGRIEARRAQREVYKQMTPEERRAVRLAEREAAMEAKKVREPPRARR